jgi:FAD/FMN-containing dehydrogenase
MGEAVLTDELERILGRDGMAAAADVSERYQVDFGGENPCAPRALLRPQSVDQLVAVLTACSAAKQPVVVQGGMTGLCGGATPLANEVAISLERMSGIEELDTESMTMTVLAGTSYRRQPPGPACSFRSISAHAVRARSAATLRPTPAATRCFASG